MGRWTAALRTPLGATAATLVAATLLLSFFAPLLWSDAADAVDTANIMAGPSVDHWAGTDHLGRDIFFRVLVASRLSVQLALLATAIMVVVGLLLGTAPLLLGRRSGRAVVTAVNVAVAFPGLLLALFFAVVFGAGATGAVLAIGLSGAPAFARLTHTLVAGVAGHDFVAAARVAGVGRFRVLLRHVLPNIAEPLVVNATVGAGGALLAFAGLSFLGLGVQAPAFDWGRLLFDGVASIYLNPAAALVPGTAVVVAGLAISLLGDAIARTLGTDAAPTLTSLASPAAADAPQAQVDVSGGPQLAAGAESDTGTESDTGAETLLDVDGLEVTVPGPGGPVRPVRGITFTIARGEAVGVVGESGSGKSLTALAVARLLDDRANVAARRLTFLGRDMLSGRPRTHRTLLGTSLAMVFQDPMTSFNPTRRIGTQLAEGARHHQHLDRRPALARAVDRLRAVRITDPDRRAQQYPHELSGGMRQRAMIAMGLMGNPALVIADEPTTALDVTVQKQVLDLLGSIRAADDVALLLISHDVSVVADVCDRVLVMYAGRIVEDLPADRMHQEARHPYTRALLAAVPHMDTDLEAPLPVVPGRPVDPAAVPPGCAYASRCTRAQARCGTEDPLLRDDGPESRIACWNPAPSGTNERVGDPLEVERA